MTCLSCGARWSRKTGLDDIQVKMGLITEQPRLTPPCPGCASTTRLQQMTNKTDTFFGCSRFHLCKRVGNVSYYGITCFTVCALVFGSSAHGGAGDGTGRDSVGSEESFRMLNVPAVSAVSQQEQQFLLEQLRHLSSSGITGVSRPTAEGQGEQGSSDLSRHSAEDLNNNTGVLQSVRVWNEKTDDNADTWEAAIRHFNKVSVSSCSLIEIDKGCLQPSVFDDSIFGEYIGSLVKSAAGAWEPAVKTNVSQNRWWDLSCDDDGSMSKPP